MVVENPLTEVQQNALDDLLDEVIAADYRDVEIATHDGTYDYEVSCKEITNAPRMRNVYFELVWYASQEDWEIGTRENSGWLS